MSWDDGKHAKVKKVQLTFDEVIYSIQVSYDGSLQSLRRGSVGPKSAEFTLGPDEYIKALSAYGKTLGSQEVITALTFTTNKKTYGPYGKKSGFQISAPEAKGKQIAGFFGTSSNVLNSIDVHYTPIPTGTGTGSGTGSGAGTGTENGAGTGNGAGTDSGADSGSGTNNGSGSGTGSGSGSGTDTGAGSGTGSGSGNGTDSGSGNETGTENGTESGTGTGTETGNGSGTGTETGSGTNSGTDSGVQKLDAQGGKGGTSWDDGSDHDGLTKIYVRSGGAGIQYVKFDYVKDEQPKQGALHGAQNRGSTREILINHPDEYLVSVKGWSDSSNIILGLQFKTNLKTSDYIGYEFDGDGTEFTLEVQDKKIVGFHGFAGNHLNSIGAYFVPSSSTTTVPPKKLEAQGGEKGAVWDDGHHDNVKKVYVGQNQDGVGAVKFEYINGSEVVFGDERGKPTLLGYEEFELESDEYITSVEGTYDQIFGSDGAIVTMLLFKTSKNKTYGPYGLEGSSKITLKEEGYKVVGFHGRAGESINAIGAYLAPLGTIPLTPATKTKKLEGFGGVGGTAWDDGTFDNVRKVSVGQAQDGIAFVKFEYANGSKVVVGEEHGKETTLGVEKFEIDADDSIVYVEGYRSKDNEDEIIKALLFKTYKGKSSKQFGTLSGIKFVLQGGKIVGFHGRSTHVLISLGAYISSSTTPNLVGNWIKVEQAGEAPGLRCSHAIAQVGYKLYSFGGEFTPNQPIDKHLYVFDLADKTWSISPATGDVPHLACLGVCMVSVGSTLYVFGGRDASRQYNGFYSFDTNTNEWKLLTPVEEGPTPRSFHSMAADEMNVYVFGGVSATQRLKTLDAYNIAEKKWVSCATPGESFSERGGAGLQVAQGKVWVIYGFNGCELDDVHCYDIAQDKWTQVVTFGEIPSGRSVFASAILGKHIVVFGGELQMDPQAHVGPGQITGGTFSLDTKTLMWERLDKLHEDEETPESRGWTASTGGMINGRIGLVMHGGKAQSNDRFDDLYFYELN